MEVKFEGVGLGESRKFLNVLEKRRVKFIGRSSTQTTYFVNNIIEVKVLGKREPFWIGNCCYYKSFPLEFDVDYSLVTMVTQEKQIY